MNKTPETTLPLKESELVKKLVRFLSEDGYKVRTEVPNLGQSADVVATRGRWVTFIEVKVKDWRRALEQCKAHSIVADYICIALGSKNISETLQNIAHEKGIGLIHISMCGECTWVVQPKVNDAIWKPQRKRLSMAMRAVQHAC